MLAKLFVILQYLVPQRALSRLIGFFADSEIRWLKNIFIRLFIKRYKVDMAEALQPVADEYRSFNAFFTRELNPQARPLCNATDAVACPADGTISQLGEIEYGKLFQAKGRSYQLTALLGGDEYISQAFMGGKFITIYLSPKDYHRVHMPFDGQLQTMVHIPGTLFSVNDATVNGVNDLFSRNERVVTLFDTNAGPMAVVLVGAMIVAGIETVWAGQITPHKRRIRTTHYPDTTEVSLSKGAELGRFKLGSTAIVLFGPDMVEWKEDLAAQSAVKMGMQIGTLINA